MIIGKHVLLIFAVLKRKWSKDLLSLHFVVRKIKDQCEDFNPLSYFDSEHFIEMLKKEAKKKNVVQQKRHTKNIRDRETTTFLIFSFVGFVIFLF